MSPVARPNVVVVLSDDHARHAISAYGSVVNRTPRIDEITSAGVRFDRFLCTNALCAPSRASILTGTYSHVNGVTTLRTHFDAAQPTFVSLLQDAGYRTAIFGKWHLGEGPAHDPRGFDDWEVLIDQGEYFDPRFLSPVGLHVRDGYATDIITDLSLTWIDRSLDESADAPWCILVWHKAPHRPWEPDEAHCGMFAAPIPVPPTFDDDYASRTEAARHATMRIADHLTPADLKVDAPAGLIGDELALWKYQRYMEDYLACVAAVDDSVGRVVDHLRSRDVFDDTILIYASDQGFFLGDHGWFDKRFFYEQSIHMPFVMSYPRAIPAGRVVAQMATNVDLAPTILDACGIAPHPRMQGRTFWPLATGASDEAIHDAMYYRYFEHDDDSHHVFAHCGVRTLTHKLIHFYNDGLGLPGTGPYRAEPQWELYDFESDPDELVNRFDDPACAGIVAQLKRRLVELQTDLDDALPTAPRG